MFTEQDVYYGYEVDRESKAAAQLPALLDEARRRGYNLKVALIPNYVDLGEVGWLWERPQQYAQFLGQELASIYRDRILIVMPNGYGIYARESVPGRERRVLTRAVPPRRTSRFLATALDIVQRLAAANGIALDVPDVAPPPGGEENPTAHALASPAAPSATPVRQAAAASSSWLFLVPLVIFLITASGLLVAARLRVTPARE